MTSSGATELDVTDDPSTAEVHNAKDPFDGTISFNTFAAETGGRAFSLSNGIDHEIEASVRDGRSFYTIAYAPSSTSNAAQAYRGIVVRVDRPGVVVRTRQGYFAKVPPAPVLSAKLARESVGYSLGTAVTSKMTFTGLTVFAAATGAPGAYALQVGCGDIAFAPSAGGAESAKLTLVAVALDAKDKPVGKVINEVNATVPAERPLSSVPFVPLSIALPLPPSAVRVRFIVRDSATGQMGSADVSLQPGR
jgi:hypothetical protein